MKTTQSKQANPKVTPAATDFVAWVGVDWADKKHDYCLCVPGRQELLSGQFEQHPESVDQWGRQLRQQCGPGKIAVAIEGCRGPLIYGLMKYDFLTLFLINPKALARYRESRYPSNAKDDPADAGLLLDLLYKHQDEMRAWQPDDVQTRHLALLVEHRRKLVDDITRVNNEVTSLLKAYYPQAFDILEKKLDTLMAVDFLLKWPTLGMLKKVKPEVLRGFFYGHNSRSSDLLAKRLEIIQKAQPLTEDTAVVESYALRVQILMSEIKTLLAGLKQYNQTIERLFAEHPRFHMFSNLPGAGVVLGPRLLVAFGSQIDRYESADKLACFSGTAPVTVRSGKSHQVHWRYARPRFVHQTFVEFAEHSSFLCPWAKCYYDYHFSKGQSPWSIYRRLAIRWQRILFGCIKSNQPYDENLYIKNLKKKNLPQYEKLNEYIKTMGGEKK